MVIEGMIIAGYAIGATAGYVYCRAEYPIAIKRPSKAIRQAEERGYLGEHILGSDHAFHRRLSREAFVCGEETALLASIEGRRGMPRPRPPFPANKGLWGKPTTINNVETLATVRHIFEKGSRNGLPRSARKKVPAQKFLRWQVKSKYRPGGSPESGTTIRELIFGPAVGMLKKKTTLKACRLAALRAAVCRKVC